MKVGLFAPLLLVLASASLDAQATPPVYDPQCYFIDADRVAKPPRFSDFPAKTSALKPAAPLMNTPLARLMRTQLRRQAAKGPNFAGRFTLAQWGAGASCSDFAVVDARSGQVFPPQFGDLSTLHDKGDVHVDFRPDSRLLILVGAPNEDETREGVHYLVWTGRRFKEIRFVPRAEVCTPDDAEITPPD